MDDTPPAEWIRLYLCRDIYHCRPSELLQEDPLIVLQDLTMLSIENKVREREAEINDQPGDL